MEQLDEVQPGQAQFRRMKNFVMGALVLLVSGVLVIVPGWAGDKKKQYGHDPEKKLQKLTKHLGLTEEQQAKVKPILEQKVQKMHELHNQMKGVRENARAQIEAQLTPEQIEKFKQMREKRKHRREHGKGKHGKKHKKDHHDNDDDDDDDDDKDEKDDD